MTTCDNQINISKAFSTILASLGENLQRPGLIKTPHRASQALLELTSGSKFTPSDILNDALFPCQSSGLVIQKDLEFYSLCEHHLLPFFGRIHVAYIPNNFIIGLSKIGRLIDIFAKRLQVQENLTHEIAHAINSIAQPHGVAVIAEASHLCMMMRGIKKQGSMTITSEYLGRFGSDHVLRTEFAAAIKS
jgi:GTP cyclohydrolase I